MSDIERRLAFALAPVEPRGSDFTARLERALTDLSDAAAEDLGAWELRAMRDPRNWARPMAAAVIGGLAGGALVVVQARQRQRRRREGGGSTLERAARSATAPLRRLVR